MSEVTKRARSHASADAPRSIRRRNAARDSGVRFNVSFDRWSTVAREDGPCFPQRSRRFDSRERTQPISRSISKLSPECSNSTSPSPRSPPEFSSSASPSPKIPAGVFQQRLSLSKISAGVFQQRLSLSKIPDGVFEEHLSLSKIPHGVFQEHLSLSKIPHGVFQVHLLPLQNLSRSFRIVAGRHKFDLGSFPPVHANEKSARTSSKRVRAIENLDGASSRRIPVTENPSALGPRRVPDDRFRELTSGLRLAFMPAREPPVFRPPRRLLSRALRIP
jgi:hypothetical protein